MTTQRLTVVQILPALDAGGVERGTLEVGKHLVEHGHRSIVISAGGRLVEQLTREGSEHVQWDIGRKNLWTLRLIPRLRRFLRDNRVDILHLRSRMPAWVAYLAWRGMPHNARPHLVTTVHGPYSVSPYSAVMSKGERVIVISEMIRDYVLKNYPACDPDKLRLIYRGVDPRVFPHGHRPTAEWLADWQRQFPQTVGKQLVTLPARITRWKGQEDMIEIMQRLKASHPNAHGLIVGEPHPRRRAFLDELRAKVRAAGLDHAISFVGHRADLREIMAISNIVLSLSREPEAFGRTTVEALSLGVPVVGYNHGGVGEQLAAILPEGAVAPGDIGAAAERIAQWLDKPPPVPETQPFTLQRMLESTLDVYLELARNPTLG
ncbi:MAG: glycosyltransferase family 4 protein [Betaproteobacteria bacterium]|nr:glycosyltransferase family 4 protein [Betaproteobacteria bacterium]